MSTEHDTETTKPSRRSAIGGFLVLTGVAAGGVVFNRSVIQPELEAKRKAEAERLAREEARKQALEQARKKVDGHLSESEGAMKKYADARVAGIRTFFDGAETGVPGFSESMLGWKSKWILIKEKAQFWKEENEEHRAYIEEQFATHVFRAEDLDSRIRKAIEDFVSRDGEAVNNQFLTGVREDVPIELIDPETTPERFEERTRESIEQNFNISAEKVYGKVGADAAGFVASSIASAIATSVLVKVGTSVGARLGTSATILAAGAGSSYFTLGIGFLAAVVIDFVLGWAINYFTDPEGDLTQTIRFELTKLERLIIEGAPATENEDAVVGLRQELQTIAELQAQSRRSAMNSILEPADT